MSDSIKIVYVNNDGAGQSEAFDVRVGTTLGQLHEIKGTRAGLCCTVNGRVDEDYKSSHYLLQDGDKVVVAPTKIKAAK